MERRLFAVLAGTLAALAGVLICHEPAAAQAPPAPTYPTARFTDGLRQAMVSSGPVTARIVMERHKEVSADLDVPVLHVLVGGKEVVNAIGAPASVDLPAAEASIAEIDPSNKSPEVYFASYSGGAHCCTRVIVASETAKGWRTVEIGDFDGDGDYLQDADKDGVAEIVTVDNRFLYAFDSYAASAAPLMVTIVRAATAIDASTDPRFRGAQRQWLAQIEEDTEPADRWTSPGFLAGWMGVKVRLGEGPPAWKDLLAHWDSAGDPGELACTTGGDIDKCARKDQKQMKFPERLKLFLDRNGYRF